MTDRYKNEFAAQLWQLFSLNRAVDLSKLADLCDHIEATNPEPVFILPDTRSTQQFVRDEITGMAKRAAKRQEEIDRLLGKE
ncbi:hypothetical protein SUSUWATARI_00290 [Serratia phage vB_SmaM-Susuwatari]|nr:hypothetical protein SUSUWATARI_00290 [Serratia phage vB_SmaM-Susuwatari]